MAVSANDPDSPAQPANPATRPPNPDTASMRYAENSEGGREVGEEPLGAIDYWRSIILYGLNTATYKLALAEALFLAQSRGETTLSYGQLGRLFYELYRERVQAGRPQLVTPGRETVVERVLRGIASGKYAEDEAVAMLARDAFGDVVPRFHTVGKAPIPVRFFEATPSGLVLTDALFRLWSDAVQPDALRAETVARWDLLEGAFTVYRTRDTRLVNDVLRYYLLRGHQRTDLTPLRPALLLLPRAARSDDGSCRPSHSTSGPATRRGVEPGPGALSVQRVQKQLAAGSWLPRKVMVAQRAPHREPSPPPEASGRGSRHHPGRTPAPTALALRKRGTGHWKNVVAGGRIRPGA
jgi:hypothetical protein